MLYSMTRIHALTREEAPEGARAIYDANVKSWGQVSNTTGIWAYRPTIQQGVKALGEGFQRSGLISYKLRCLINVRIASQVGCGF
jgi:hypothetical protein